MDWNILVMSYATLRPQIKTLISTLNTIQEVSGTPKTVFGGYPAAYVLPSDNEADYETTTENTRTFAFIVRIFYDTKEGGVEGAFEALEGIVDSILDLFDQEDLKGVSTRTVGINLPAAYTFINIWATPGEWGELPDEQLLMAEMRIRVRVSVDIS